MREEIKHLVIKMNENKQLRYLVQAGEEMGDDVKLSIVREMIDEGDMCVTISQIYDEVNSSSRTIRRHIEESRLIERVGSQGVVLVDTVDQTSERALRVAVSCREVTNQNGLPQFEGDRDE